MGNRYGRENKSTRRATVTPTLRQLEWAAGFLEGEGCFRIATTSMSVTAVQKQKEPLTRLAAMFGGAVRRHTWKKSNCNRRYHHWGVSGARARGVAMALYALMSPRRQRQIRKAIEA